MFFLIEILIVYVIQELNFWIVNRSVEVTKNFKRYKMYQYRTESTGPRPESYCSDVRTAIKSKEKNKTKLWQNLASAAESGMDFSCKGE